VGLARFSRRSDPSDPGKFRSISGNSMNVNDKPLILLTNDDGIRSPGLWAAADALSELGFVVVAAPREQSSGYGRSLPNSSDGVIREEEVTVRGKTWKVFAVGGSPAQAVQCGVLEIAPRQPDLVVAGINYGENVGLGVTISGTVGAALEAAALGIPALAVSVEAEPHLHLSYSPEVDFSTAAFFTQRFAKVALRMEWMHDVDVIKVEVPRDATVETPWRLTHLTRAKYYVPLTSARDDLDEASSVGYTVSQAHETFEPGSDAYALRVLHQVAVTPLSIDLTSRVDFQVLESLFRGRDEPGTGK
jgi:5'-nucleotidase